MGLRGMSVRDYMQRERAYQMEVRTPRRRSGGGRAVRHAAPSAQALRQRLRRTAALGACAPA